MVGVDGSSSRSSSVSRSRSLSESFKSFFKPSSEVSSPPGTPRVNQQGLPHSQPQPTSRHGSKKPTLGKIAVNKEYELKSTRNGTSIIPNDVSPLHSPKLSATAGKPLPPNAAHKLAPSPSRATSVNSQESYVTEDDYEDKIDFPISFSTATSIKNENNISATSSHKDESRRSRSSSINTGSLIEETNNLSIDAMLDSDKQPSRTSSMKSYAARTKNESNQSSRAPSRYNSYSHHNSSVTGSNTGANKIAPGSSSSSSMISRHNSTSRTKPNNGNSSGNSAISKSNSLKKVDSTSSISSMSANTSKTQHSIRGRPHAETISASGLPRNYRNTSCYHMPQDDSKCILQAESFKVYENGTHQHNLKTISLVHGPEDGDIGGKVGSMFSFSGFFKSHPKSPDDTGNDANYKEDEHFLYFKDAISLIPNKPIGASSCRSRSNNRSDDSMEEEESKDKKKLKKGIPQVVNPKAAVSSDELELINTLSEKILKGLSVSTKIDTIKKTNVDIDDGQPIFLDLYGKSIGTIGQGAYGVVSVSSRPINIKDAPPLPTFNKNGKMYFAVKELKPRESDQIEKFSTKITSEFIIGHSLSRTNKIIGRPAPNILKVLDLMEKDNTFIEVMEFCPSGDLYSLLTRKSKSGTSLHPLEADCFMKQLLNGVKYMHDRGVAHCDLKPENILFHPDGLLKICDFGTSCVFQTAWEKHVHFQSGAMGSEPYVAPEEFAQDQEYDPRLVDCWSIGVVYCTMVLGHFLWKIAVKSSDSLYDSFIEEMGEDKQFYLFEELRHVNHEINKLRKIALYKIFQINPTKRITIDELLTSSWMKRTRCCISYKKPLHDDIRK